MSDCDRTALYFDGELSGDEEAAALSHLAMCASCQAELGDFIGLEVAMSRSAGRPAAHARSPRRWRWSLAGAAALAVAAAAALVVLGRTDPPGAPRIALAETRTIEARFTARELDRHRPYRVARGAAERELIALETMAALERAGDRAALAAAHLLAGETDRARTAAEAEAPGAGRSSDLAAVALAAGDAETALRHADAAVAADPKLMAARWNRALALRALDLPLAAAVELDRVAAQNEPGWSDEARTRAATIRGPIAARLDDAAARAALELEDAALSSKAAAEESRGRPELAAAYREEQRLRRAHGMRERP